MAIIDEHHTATALWPIAVKRYPASFFRYVLWCHSFLTKFAARLRQAIVKIFPPFSLSRYFQVAASEAHCSLQPPRPVPRGPRDKHLSCLNYGITFYSGLPWKGTDAPRCVLTLPFSVRRRYEWERPAARAHEDPATVQLYRPKDGCSGGHARSLTPRPTRPSLPAPQLAGTVDPDRSPPHPVPPSWPAYRLSQIPAHTAPISGMSFTLYEAGRGTKSASKNST